MNMFEDSKFLTENVLTHKLPKELFKELTVFLKSANKKRKSKYGFLVSHDNHGKNSYQISVDSYLFEKSLMFGYLIKLGEYYYNNKSSEKITTKHRKIRLRRNVDHYDHYDFWINFSKKNSYNETHTHAGILSGVIYYTDCFNCPTEFHDLNFYGKSKDVLIFPSDTKHGVKKQNTNKTRITFAFNLYAV